MDFIDKINALAINIPKLTDHVQTEEATKNALVMPFIQALGYNVFDPTEVVPELTADVGVKKGEKVDYAIMSNAEPIILFECKCLGCDLDREHASQLYRYFNVTKARFGVLTNGVVYRFYTDLEEPNKMDSKPFFEFNMLDIKESLVEELKKFSKSSWNIDRILATASELKYTKEIKRILAEQLSSPSEEFVRFFASKVYSGKLTQSVREQFTEITRRALAQFISDRVSDRLKTALSDETELASKELIEEIEVANRNGDEIITTEEEMEAYFIIKSIVREVIDVRRVIMRDAKSYCAIILDDNNRKPICRFRFGSNKMQIGLIDSQKKEELQAIEVLDDIYKFADEIKATIGYYDKN